MRVVLVLAEGVSWHELLGKDSGCLEISTITVIRVCWKSWNPHVSVYACIYIYICVFYIHMFIDIYSDKIHMLHDNIHTSYMINCMYIIYIHICVWRICFHVYWHRFLFSSRAHGQVSGLCTSWRRSLLGTTSWKIIGPNGAFFSKTHTVT